MRIVSSGGLRGPQLTYYLESYPSDPPAGAAAGGYEKVRTRQRRHHPRRVPLDDWLPPSVEVRRTGAQRLLSPDCTAPSTGATAPTALGLTTVTALSLARPDAGARAHVGAEPRRRGVRVEGRAVRDPPPLLARQR